MHSELLADKREASQNVIRQQTVFARIDGRRVGSIRAANEKRRALSPHIGSYFDLRELGQILADEGR